MKSVLTYVLLTISVSAFGQSQIIDVSSSTTDYIPYRNFIDSSFANCDSSWNTNVEWGECIGTHQALWEELMLHFYDTLMAELDTNGQRLLKLSQTAWSNQIQTQEEFWSYFEDIPPGYFGREGHFKAYYHALFAKRERAIELRAYLQGVAGT